MTQFFRGLDGIVAVPDNVDPRLMPMQTYTAREIARMYGIPEHRARAMQIAELHGPRDSTSYRGARRNQAKVMG